MGEQSIYIDDIDLPINVNNDLVVIIGVNYIVGINGYRIEFSFV